MAGLGGLRVGSPNEAREVRTRAAPGRPEGQVRPMTLSDHLWKAHRAEDGLRKEEVDEEKPVRGWERW